MKTLTAKEYLNEHGYDPYDQIHKPKSGGVTQSLYYILEQFAKLKCKEQREICALKSNLINDNGEISVNEASILNAPEPNL